MDINKVLSIFNEIFIDVLEDDDIKLEYETTAKDVDDWDSLNHIMLVVAIEKHFELQFSADEVQGFKNVGEMCEAVINKK
ncbi:MAG: acyl carrier protein [Polaribacter sp.]